jgi:site-specific DNA-methyltransferase (adenine-specific)
MRLKVVKGSQIDTILEGDSINILKKCKSNQFHLILSDIPYGICYEEWDVLHDNTNKALLGSSPAQKKSGSAFKHRGKPLNGWSKADKNISLDYYNWCKSWSSEWLRVLKPGASTFIFAGRRMSHRCISAMEDSGFIFKDMLAWEKDIAPHRAQRLKILYSRRGDNENSRKWKNWRLGNLRPTFEPILWFMKPYKIGGTIADNVLEYGVGAFNDVAWNSIVKNSSNVIKVKFDKNDRGLHPAQKPIQLMEALIRLTTRKGQKVLDPFCGSGTTLVAAKNLGIERLSMYVDIAKQRLEEN